MRNLLTSLVRFFVLGAFLAACAQPASDASDAGGAASDAGKPISADADQPKPADAAQAGATGAGGAGGQGQGGDAGSTGGGPGTGGAPDAAVTLPPANASFDYQIGGPYTPPSGVKVVSRDREAPIASGLYNICYVNGFQAQPQDESWWLSKHPQLVLKDASGAPVKDTEWNELIFDTRTESSRSQLVAIVGGWIEKCAQDGFDAVEIDNLDSYGRSKGLLTQEQNVAFMALLSKKAHAHGLAAAQKNSTDLVGRRAQMGTDFAVAEECNRYDECDVYRNAYGDRVFVIEYRKADFDKGCKAHPGLSIVLRDLGVSPAGAAGYVFEGC
ncbi:MAG: endo alpha-1,4 polygalactosaminidase [Deltaproteobacteria bacterium]|nr:endo alpha-1,4 polygalactosaminidase [Deltaproteobacteria bacterium]